MVAPVVGVLIVTVCGEPYVPAPGLNAGVATCIVYVAEATALSVRPPAYAIAFIVVFTPTVIGPV